MNRIARFALALIALFVWLIPVCAPAQAIVNRPGATNLIVYNASNANVVVMLKSQGAGSGVGDGCPTLVTHFAVIDLATGRPLTVTPFTATTTGWFILKRGAKVQLLNKLRNPYTGQVSSCLQGFNLCFGATFDCPTSLGGTNPFPVTTVGPLFNTKQNPSPNLPNGSNAAEGSLNMPGTIGGSYNGGALNEGLDISCVNGANSTLVMTITPPVGGPYWSVENGVQLGGKTTLTRTTSTRNSWVDIANECDANCVDPATGSARLGIYPFGCSLCNVFPDPGKPCPQPPGPSGKQFCAAKNGVIGNNGCAFARSPLNAGVPSFSTPPVQKFGGTVQITYLGPLSPPGTCPPGTKQ